MGAQKGIAGERKDQSGIERLYLSCKKRRPWAPREKKPQTRKAVLLQEKEMMKIGRSERKKGGE